MGDMKTTYVIVGILLYFLCFFLVLLTITSGKRELGYEELGTTYNDPGFQAQNNPYDTPEHCGGIGTSMNFLSNVLCENLIIDDMDVDGCNNISGCEWRNYTDLFGIEVLSAGCGGGLVNETFYNITKVQRLYCEKSSGISNNRSLCLTFGCNWINDSDTGASENLGATFGVGSLWQDVKYIVALKADIGLGEWNFIIQFIFFFLPMIALIVAIIHLFPLK